MGHGRAACEHTKQPWLLAPPPCSPSPLSSPLAENLSTLTPWCRKPRLLSFARSQPSRRSRRAAVSLPRRGKIHPPSLAYCWVYVRDPTDAETRIAPTRIAKTHIVMITTLIIAPALKQFRDSMQTACGRGMHIAG